MLVQDPGVAALAREIVPGLALHASTQLTIHNAEGVRWAHAQGFSRVVLARELPLSEMEAIARATADTGIGLEVFAHGALCYSYSGQCLLSSVIGGRSGNRGMCAQPCRKKYTLVTAEVDRYGRPTGLHDVPLPGPYLLSPKDLCTYREIPRLADAPVASLKIEGRMKSPEYVAIVVSTYRRALDAAAAGTFVPDETAVRDLCLAFNRGFTRGYLFGDRKGKLMGRDRPDNRGLLHRDRVPVRPQERDGNPLPGSGRSPCIPGTGSSSPIPDHPAAEWGYALNSEPGVKNGGDRTCRSPSRCRKGRGSSLHHRSISPPAPGRSPGREVPDCVSRSRPISWRGHSRKGSSRLRGRSIPPGKEPVTVEKAGDLRLAPARTRPLTREQLAAQLEKTGGTPFAVSHLTLDYDGTLFAPVSEINRVRREFFARAEEALVAASRPFQRGIKAAQQRLDRFHCTPSAGTPASPKTLQSPDRAMGIILYTDSLESVEAGARAGAETICFEPRGLPGSWHGGNQKRKGPDGLGIRICA